MGTAAAWRSGAFACAALADGLDEVDGLDEDESPHEVEMAADEEDEGPPLEASV